MIVVTSELLSRLSCHGADFQFYSPLHEELQNIHGNSPLQNFFVIELPGDDAPFWWRK